MRKVMTLLSVILLHNYEKMQPIPDRSRLYVYK